jgi:hypothetical protein
MDSQMRLTESVRVLLALFGDTNASLAGVLGQSASSAASKRTGRVPWTPSDVDRLATHYGVTVDQLQAGPRAWLGLPDAA